MIESVYREIAALLFATETPDAFVQELSAADARQDAYAGALALFAQAYLRLPGLEPSDRAALIALQSALIPAVDDVQGTYATQASRAIERGRALGESEREILTRFRIRGEDSLATLFDAYVATGRELDGLLRRRADQSQRGAPDRREAGQLRGRAIGLLSQLRSSLSAEFADQPQRAAELDAQTFAYILHRRAQRGPQTTRSREPREARARKPRHRGRFKPSYRAVTAVRARLESRQNLADAVLWAGRYASSAVDRTLGHIRYAPDRDRSRLRACPICPGPLPTARPSMSDMQNRAVRGMTKHVEPGSSRQSRRTEGCAIGPTVRGAPRTLRGLHHHRSHPTAARRS